MYWLTFELRVDHTVTKNNRETILEYLQCILNIAEQACEPSEIPEYLYIGFAKKEDAGMLTKRVHYLIEKAEKPEKPVLLWLYCPLPAWLYPVPHSSE